MDASMLVDLAARFIERGDAAIAALRNKPSAAPAGLLGEQESAIQSHLEGCARCRRALLQEIDFLTEYSELIEDESFASVDEYARAETPIRICSLKRQHVTEATTINRLTRKLKEHLNILSINIDKCIIYCGNVSDIADDVVHVVMYRQTGDTWSGFLIGIKKLHPFEPSSISVRIGKNDYPCGAGGLLSLTGKQIEIYSNVSLFVRPHGG